MGSCRNEVFVFRSIGIREVTACEEEKNPAKWGNAMLCVAQVAVCVVNIVGILKIPHCFPAEFFCKQRHKEENHPATCVWKVRTYALYSSLILSSAFKKNQHLMEKWMDRKRHLNASLSVWFLS